MSSSSRDLPAHRGVDEDTFASVASASLPRRVRAFSTTPQRSFPNAYLSRQPSIVDLLTALPLLLSMDRSDYTDTLNSLQPLPLPPPPPAQQQQQQQRFNTSYGAGQAFHRDEFVQQTAQFNSAAVALNRTLASPFPVTTSPYGTDVSNDVYGDAASAAVAAVLRRDGTASWQARRRRMRRAALDAFFRPSLPAQISARCRGDADLARRLNKRSFDVTVDADGVHTATMRLLAHTRAVMSTVSPTQVQLVDLFAEQILRSSRDSSGSTSAKSPVPESKKPRDAAANVGERESNVNEEDVKASDPHAQSTSLTEAASTRGSPRGIMKTSMWPAESATKAAAASVKTDGDEAARQRASVLSDAPIAEQLLYIILRTSIAANTPLRGNNNNCAVDDVALEQFSLSAAHCSRDDENDPASTSPFSQPTTSAGVPLTPSPISPSSSPSSLTRKKPRLDSLRRPDFDAAEAGSEGNAGTRATAFAATPSQLFSLTERESIRHHASNTGARSGGAGAVAAAAGIAGDFENYCGGVVLPYEPQCWLGPSTIALVERSEALRRQQRWRCDGDPVIEATIAGDGADSYYSPQRIACGGSDGDAWGVGTETGSLHGRRSHWVTSTSNSIDAGEEATTFASLVRDSALPFSTVDSRQPHAGKTAAFEGYRVDQFLRSDVAPSGELHWALDGVGLSDAEGDPAVQSLFTKRSSASDADSTNERTANAEFTVEEAGRNSKKRSVPASLPPSHPQLSLPACRTPFVACTPLYDPTVYAHVYVALHRCTAGLIDPYELTTYDTQGGRDWIEIRVQTDLYTKKPPCSKGKSLNSTTPLAHSGLTSMLEWGCRCGTLLLRLHRLCEVADDCPTAPRTAADAASHGYTNNSNNSGKSGSAPPSSRYGGGTALRASLGNYGRCAVDALRLLLCLLQRQIGELGDRPGGWHQLTFTELLTAQQRLQKAAEQIEALAAFFSVPSTSAAEAAACMKKAAAATGARGRTKSAAAAAAVTASWDPVVVLRDTCTSALLISRLHQLFTARHANALGRHGSVAAAYGELQRESIEAWTAQLDPRGAGASSELTEEKNRVPLRGSTFSSVKATGSCVDGSATETQQERRKDLLCQSIDAIGLLLRATLRPLHAMLHRWLTAGEVNDPYDEFFVVPSHGQTHSGFTLDLSPQRLPIFISPAAATDLLHAGVSLRVLRAAATHVVRSAQKDVRRLHGLAEVTEAAAEDFAEELLDTQTLQCAVERFVERLVRGAPTVAGVASMGRHFEDGLAGKQQLQGVNSEERDGGRGDLTLRDGGLPLPPRVDVLSAYGAINWWRQHYQACTQVLLEAVEEAAGGRGNTGVDAEEEGEAQVQWHVSAPANAEMTKKLHTTSANTHANSLSHETTHNEEEETEHDAVASPALASPSTNPASGSQVASGPASTSDSAFAHANTSHASDVVISVKSPQQKDQQNVQESQDTKGEGKVSASSSAVDTTAATRGRSGVAHLTYPPGLAPPVSLPPSTPASPHREHSDDSKQVSAGANVHQQRSIEDEEGDQQPYITVFMNSSDEDDVEAMGSREGASRTIASGGAVKMTATAARDATGHASLLQRSPSLTPSASSASSSSFAASSATSLAASASVLGLHRIAHSNFSTGTTVSSTASSRGTVALYGAITEELRQVSLMQAQNEVRVGQSRHALREEFQQQLWRRRRAQRLAEWQAQRLALRLRRIRAMEAMVEELRDVYGIRGAGYVRETEEEKEGEGISIPSPRQPAAQSAMMRLQHQHVHQQESAAAPLTGGLRSAQHSTDNEEEAEKSVDKAAEGATVPSVTVQPHLVIPLRTIPPPRAPPPVLLYSEEDAASTAAEGEGLRRGLAGQPARGGLLTAQGRPRRTSFAATTTVIELPSHDAARWPPLPLPLLQPPASLNSRTLAAAAGRAAEGGKEKVEASSPSPLLHRRSSSYAGPSPPPPPGILLASRASPRLRSVSKPTFLLSSGEETERKGGQPNNEHGTTEGGHRTNGATTAAAAISTVAARTPLSMDVRATSASSSPRGRAGGNTPRSLSTPASATATAHSFADPLASSLPSQKSAGETLLKASLTSNPASSSSSSTVRQLRDVSLTFASAQRSGSGVAESRARPSTTAGGARNEKAAGGGGSSGSIADILAPFRSETMSGVKALHEQWYRTTAVPASTSLEHAAQAEEDKNTFKTSETLQSSISHFLFESADREEEDGPDGSRVRRDELGYAHPDANYVVADINDDEFLQMRTGPRSHAKWEVEEAALARLAAERAALDRCTVDAPEFLSAVARTAHALLRVEAEEDEADIQQNAGVETQAQEEEEALEDEATAHRTTDGGGGFMNEKKDVTAEAVRAIDLSDAWRGDDPQERLLRPADKAASHARPDDPLDHQRNGGRVHDCTARLWSWSPAEAHRWYFDYRVPLHHVLTNHEVDDALLVDLPLTSDEAEALQCCGGYYRALGHYTARFLTHKALQLTLLPPYGSLYRLTTQFLDVCLLQKSSVAVRVVDTWIAAVDAALGMMAEEEEAAMVAAVVAGETHVPAPLARLTDAQQGLNLTSALAALNTVFQREWASAVEKGDTTVTLEWKLLDLDARSAQKKGQGHHTRRQMPYAGGKGSVPATPRLGSTQHLTGATGAAAEEDELDLEDEATTGVNFELFLPEDANGDGDDADAGAFDGAAPSAGWHFHDRADEVKGTRDVEGAKRGTGAAAEDADDQRVAHASTASATKIADNHRPNKRASPIQAFLAALQLTPVSPWCSGAWLLPERTTRCLGGVCRTLLFWKSAERVVLHTWQAGMTSGLSSVFFFCTTVRQVLLSTLQEQLWGRLQELTAAYRESLRFEAGVLYTYRALENFTVDHEKFLQDCEFYTLCGSAFQRRVQPLLRAMMREVEVAERALRFAQVSTRVAQRQYMATFHSMVSRTDSSSDSDEEAEGRGNLGGRPEGKKAGLRESSAHSGKQADTHFKAAASKVPGSAALPVKKHVFTPSRLCRRQTSRVAPAATTSPSRSTPWYLRPIEDALNQHAQSFQEAALPALVAVPEQRAEEEEEEKEQEASPIPLTQSLVKGKKKKMRKKPSSFNTSSATTQSTQSGGGGGGGRTKASRSVSASAKATSPENRSVSALSSTTTTTTLATHNTTFTSLATHAEEEGGGEEREVGDEDTTSSSEDGSSSGSNGDDSQSSSPSSRDTEEELNAAASTTTITTAEATGPGEEKKKRKKTKRRRRAVPPAKAGPPRRSIMESATMNTTPIYAGVLAAQQQQLQLARAGALASTAKPKRSRSTAAGARQSTALHHVAALQAATVGDGSTSQTSSTAPAIKRHRDQHAEGMTRRRQKDPREPRMTSAERQERREKLRVIAQRKIKEETEHQRRLMRDVIARRLRRFATLTQLLRDALNDIIAKEDLAAQENFSHVTEAQHGTEAEDDSSANCNAGMTAAAAAKELHDAQRKQMSRFTYLSAMVRRLDSLIEVMASQV